MPSTKGGRLHINGGNATCGMTDKCDDGYYRGRALASSCLMESTLFIKGASVSFALQSPLVPPMAGPRNPGHAAA